MKTYNKNTIVKIEDDYRQTGNVKDFYERWNKLPKTNGIFENWVEPYEFQSKALTKKDLKVLQQEDSSFIFNRFLEILRHNVVSDKPNAFNKIFTLFLCKIADEYSKDENDELEFQWLEGKDNDISFQKRLTDLYNKGMREFLEKNVTDVSDEELDKRFQNVDEKYQEEFRKILTEIRLKKNNEFAIKEVYDDESFNENAKVAKEVVELLQFFKIRYTYRQQFLSDFFELLLTTGLKQESGQFFTPVPIARFIIKSLPFQQIINEKIGKGNKNDLLPTIIDYAAGSGHFITESMEEVQKYLDSLELEYYKPETRKQLKGFREVQFDWAEKYVYGIEKDYRLVKTAKVSCYLHGDGLAKVIHGDGLDDFATSKHYKDLLKITDKTYPQDNKQFDILISNPPYSVSAFKGMMEENKAKQAFELYSRLTDQSSEIECLFIERTKQLLKDGGVAGIILPSSILNNIGIYTQTREIILKYFDILGITELGSGTFMATGTNTVTLFLRRRSNVDSFNIEEAVRKFFINLKDVTINGIEKPVLKYITHVWEGLNFEDYITLLNKNPNEAVKKHDIYKEYFKKIKVKNDVEKWNNILALEQEKLLYFIIAYPQKIVLVKTGEKNEEKRFLGYEFSYRRGSEGIHPMQGGKTIDDCTQLFDVKSFYNPEKASTYIYKAFQGEFDLDIPESLQQNVSYQNLVDMLTFNRVTFEKNISLSAKKKIKIESKWEIKRLSEISNIDYGTRIVRKQENGSIYPVYGGGGETFKSDKFNREDSYIISRFGMSPETVRFVSGKFFLNDSGMTLNALGVNQKYLDYYLFLNQNFVYDCGRGVAQKNIDMEAFSNIPIPLPDNETQEKIIKDIEALEKQENKIKEDIRKKQDLINKIVGQVNADLVKLEEVTSKIGSGATPKGGESVYKQSGITFIRSQNVYDNSFLEKGLVYLDAEQAKKLNNVTVEKNDILFNITGASIARSCIVEDKYLPARVNQHVSIIRVTDKALPKYVMHMLISEVYKNKLLEIGDGATSREAITKVQLEEFKIPLPSISEQQKIVAQIEEIENKIAKLEKEIAEIPKQKETILKKYLN